MVIYMRTEKEIVNMLVRVAECFDCEEYMCPFLYTCSWHIEDSCRDNWTKWIRKGEVNNEEKQRRIE